MVSPAGSVVSLNRDLDKIEQPNVNPNRFHMLKSTFSSVAVMQTTKLVAFVGLLFFGYASKLVPAALCIAIITIATILKNRVTKIDAKKLENQEKGQLKKTVSKLVFVTRRMSNISDRSNVMTRPSRVSNSCPSIGEENSHEIDATFIKETFLNSIEDRVDNKPQWHDLLAICYMNLYKKQGEIPTDLHKSWPEKLTESYLERKIKQHAEKGTGAIAQLEVKEKNLKKAEKHYDLTKLREDQSIITEATPSEIMEIVQELYSNISRSEPKKKNKIHVSDNADHAKEYASQLKEFENLEATQKMQAQAG